MVKLAAAPLGYGALVAVAHALDGPEYARFGVGFSMVMLCAALASGGLNTAVLRFLPEYNANNEERLGLAYLDWAQRSALRLSIVGCLLFSVYLYVTQTLTSPPLAAACYLFAYTLSEFLNNAVRASGKMMASILPRDYAFRLVWIAFVLLFARSASEAFGIAALTLTIINLLQLLYLQRTARSKNPPIRQPMTQQASSRQLHRRWWKTSSFMWAASVIFAVSQNIDVIIVGLNNSPAEGADYFAAARTAGALGLFLAAVNTISTETISRLYYSNQREALQRQLRLFASLAFIPSLGSVAIFALFGDRVLSIFGSAVTPRANVLVILALAQLASAAAGPSAYLLLLAGLHREAVLSMGAVYVCAIPLEFLATHAYGPMGAASVAMLSAIVVAAAQIWIARSRLQLDPSILSFITPRLAEG